MFQYIIKNILYIKIFFYQKMYYFLFVKFLIIEFGLNKGIRFGVLQYLELGYLIGR